MRWKMNGKAMKAKKEPKTIKAPIKKKTIAKKKPLLKPGLKKPAASALHNKITLAAWNQLLTALGPEEGKSGPLDLARKYKNSCMRLWEGFTGHKSLPRDYLANPEFRIAYLLGFHLINAARMENLLERVSGERGISFPKLPIDLWDFGCGTGAMTSTLMDFISKKRLPLGDINLCDVSRQLLGEVEKALVQAIPPTTRYGKVQLHVGKFSLAPIPLTSAAQHRVQLISFGYFLNELDEQARDKMVKWMGKAARSPVPVVILIVDSSDEEICRGLMDFRDDIVDGGLHPLYPCPHSCECPMAGSKDWCYSEARWRLPLVQQKIDKIIMHPRRTMTMSSYAFANESFLALQTSREIKQRVLVGKPVDKFRKELQIPVYCQADGELHKDLEGARAGLSWLRGSVAPKPRG
jgi:hypothetical protein